MTFISRISIPGFSRLQAVRLLPLLALLVMGLAGCKGCNQPVVLNPADTSAHDVAVFFTKNRGNHSVVEGVVRKLPTDYPGKPVQYAVESLLSGPTADETRLGYFSEIPRGTRLLSLTAEDHTLKVNLSREFTSGGGANSMIQRMAELQNTIIAANKDGRISINIEINGQPLQTAGGEGLEIPETPSPQVQ